MDEYQRNRIASLVAWRAFARSAAIFTTVLFTMVTKNPIESLGKGIIVWLLFYAIRQLDDKLVDRNLWSCCSPIVFIISFWPIRIPFLVVSAIFVINLGAEVKPVLLVFGGLLIYDLLFILGYGS
jgi:hypothetical protein